MVLGPYLKQHHWEEPRTQTEAGLDLHSPKVQLTHDGGESVEYFASPYEKSRPVLDATQILDATLSFRSSGVHVGI